MTGRPFCLRTVQDGSAATDVTHYFYSSDCTTFGTEIGSNNWNTLLNGTNTYGIGFVGSVNSKLILLGVRND
ncbi:MAG TPA: hypothetical protein VE621_09615 [Bryobacteraceae bacterium]|jgi:hypothetical protein|nr:hypothetical protein [Bryobacteraceae bacterium]